MKPPTLEEISQMKLIFKQMKYRTPLFEEWENYFREYNRAHQFAPLHMDCGSCYYKVYNFIRKQYGLADNDRIK